MRRNVGGAGAAFSVTPATRFKPTAAELPPGSPRRKAVIDRLVTKSFTAGPVQTVRIAAQLRALDLSPQETAYVQRSSATRGNAAIRAKARADLHDFTHTFLPQVGHVADVAVTGGAVGDLKHGRYRSLPVDALAILPIGKGARAIKAALGLKATEDALRIAKAEKATKAAATVKGARVTYRGGVPRVAKGTAPDILGGEAGQQVREGLRGAKTAYKKQATLYTAERSKRAAAAEEALQAGGREGYHAALAKLKGELPKLTFDGLKDFDEESVTQLINHVRDHPTLRPFEKVRTIKALLGVVDHGRVPTPSQLDLLGRAFGKEVSTQLTQAATTFQKAAHLGVEVLNVPRALLASFDLSAPFRQGLMAGVAHPLLFAKNFKPMAKALFSENAYQNIMDEIVTRPTFAKMQESGLALTDLGELSAREEQFMSNLAEHIPVIGRGVRGSGRAYTGFLNKMRADVFDSLVHDAAAAGRDVRDPKLLKDISKFVNSATGRGSLGKLNEHTAALNALFFSPRLMASRFNFLNPVYYASLDPFVRKQALKSAFVLVGATGTILTLAKLAGAKVNTDPRNADFAKIRIGNTRIDILGGFQQPVRLLAEVASGKIVSSTTGKTLTLGPAGPGKLSRGDIIERFFESKAAPVPSLLHDVAYGTDFTGRPLDWGFTMRNPAFQRMVPLLVQDVKDLYHDTGSIPAVVGGYALGGVGLGLQTYGPEQPSGGQGDGTPNGGWWGGSSGGDSSGSSDGWWGGSESSWEPIGG